MWGNLAEWNYTQDRVLANFFLTPRLSPSNKITLTQPMGQEELEFSEQLLSTASWQNSPVWKSFGWSPCCPQGEIFECQDPHLWPSVPWSHLLSGPYAGYGQDLRRPLVLTVMRWHWLWLRGGMVSDAGVGEFGKKWEVLPIPLNHDTR